MQCENDVDIKGEPASYLMLMLKEPHVLNVG